MTSYGFTVKWNRWGRGEQAASVTGCSSPEEARRKAFELAAYGDFGWRPRRWYQFWRWSDTPNREAPEDMLKVM